MSESATEGDFWTPDGWRRAPLRDDARELMSAQGDWNEALKVNGYNEWATFGGDDPYTTTNSLKLYRHDETKHLYIEVWGGDYCLAEFFVERNFITPFIVDRLPDLVRGYGLQDDQAVVAEMKLLRKVFAAFVRHEHGTHVVDEDGEETMEERHARNERLRLHRERQEEAKRAKLAEGAAQ